MSEKDQAKWLLLMLKGAIADCSEEEKAQVKAAQTQCAEILKTEAGFVGVQIALAEYQLAKPD